MEELKRHKKTRIFFNKRRKKWAIKMKTQWVKGKSQWFLVNEWTYLVKVTDIGY